MIILTKLKKRHILTIPFHSLPSKTSSEECARYWRDQKSEHILKELNNYLRKHVLIVSELQEKGVPWPGWLNKTSSRSWNLKEVFMEMKIFSKQRRRESIWKVRSMISSKKEFVLGRQNV